MIWKTVALVALAALGACSQTESARTDIEESSSGSDPDKTMSAEDARIVAEVERTVRNTYAERGIEVVRVDLAPDGEGGLAGSITIIDPETNENVNANCTVPAVGDRLGQLHCVDTRPNMGRRFRSTVDTLIEGESENDRRAFIEEEMGRVLAGDGRTFQLQSFEQVGDQVTAVFETRDADGNATYRSVCSGDRRIADNGAHAIEFTCRIPA